MGALREGVPGRSRTTPSPGGGAGALWASVCQPGWKRHLVLPNAPGPGTKQPWYFCLHSLWPPADDSLGWREVRSQQRDPAHSSEAGRSAQAELLQAATLLRTATGVFFQSMGGILPATAFDLNNIYFL